MAHIVCITTGLTGILNASFELIHRLAKDGHHCAYACPSQVDDRVVDQGIKYIQLKPVNYDPAPPVPISARGLSGKIRKWYYKFKYRKSRREEAIASLGMHDFMTSMEGLQPDLIIIDIELHEHIMSLVAQQYNVLLLSQWFSTWHRKGLPPIMDTTIPGKNLSGTALMMSLRWQMVKLNRSWIFFKKALFSVGADRRSVLKAYAKKIGFPLQYIKENYWPGPFSYDVLPVISIVSEQMDFPHDRRPHHYYVGAMVDEKRSEDFLTSAEEARLAHAIAIKEKEGKQLVYCSVSTFKAGDTGFLEKVIAAFTDQEELILVIGLGGMVAANAFKDLPDNVYAFSKVPQLRILKIADLSINHGGIHTINECIHFKVPMLIYSGKRSDQNGCAARVQYHGLGIMADKDQDSPVVILQKVRKALSNTFSDEKYKKFQSPRTDEAGALEAIVRKKLDHAL